MRFRLALLVLSALAGHADVRDCVCDLSSPNVAQIRGCSLCIEAEKHPSTERVFLTRDNDPTKPNRWLAIPRSGGFDGANPLAKMGPEDRLLLWNTAVAKGKEAWGDDWAVAMNGDIARRQCHAHVHIGKLLDDKKSAEIESAGVFVNGPAELPEISDGAGLWFHPLGGRLHVHTGEQITETVLMR